MDVREYELNKTRYRAIQKKLDYIGMLTDNLKNDVDLWAWAIYGNGHASDATANGVSYESIDRLIKQTRAELVRLRGLL